MKSLLLLMTLGFIGISWSQSNSVTLKDDFGLPISSHMSITEAYNAIPATISAPYTIELESTYNGSSEVFPIQLTPKTGSSSINTITIQPALGTSNLLIQSTQSGGNIFTINDADYIIIDGRPGGIGSTSELSISNLGTTSSSNTIQFINGACFNIIRYCSVLNSTSGSAGRNIHFSTSVSNPSGNSNNLIENCFLPNGRYRINSNGTSANPNTRIDIKNCTFENINFVAIWGQTGTGKMKIDANTFYGNTASGSGLFFGILFDAQNDTTIISNNQMYDLQNSSSGTIRYISIRSTLAGSTNLTTIQNNTISMNTGNQLNTNVGGIEYGGSNQASGRMFNNTIYIGGTLTSAGTSGSVASSGIHLNNSNTLSTYEVKNNVVTNQRTGGTSVQHVALYDQSTAGTMDIDYNSYSATSNEITRVGTTVYNDLLTYQTALAPNEFMTNTALPSFSSVNDLHLDMSEIGNSMLQGTPIVGLNTDIDGDVRVFPYRGADELPVTCIGTPTAGTTMTNADTLCENDAFTLMINGSTESGIVYQWQESTDGISFSDLTGETDTIYNGILTQSSYYQCIVTCLGSGLSDTSSLAYIYLLPEPAGGTINANSTDFDFDFDIVGLASGNYTYSWDFDDGSTSIESSPSHTFGSNGSYNVTVIVSNDCGSDTLDYSVSLSVGISELENQLGLNVYPNPVHDILTIVSDEALNNVQYQIYDLSGKIISDWKTIDLPTEIQIGEQIQSAGMYFLHIKTDSAYSIIRVEKQ